MGLRNAQQCASSCTEVVVCGHIFLETGKHFSTPFSMAAHIQHRTQGWLTSRCPASISMAVGGRVAGVVLQTVPKWCSCISGTLCAAGQGATCIQPAMMWAHPKLQHSLHQAAAIAAPCMQQSAHPMQQLACSKRHAAPPGWLSNWALCCACPGYAVLPLHLPAASSGCQHSGSITVDFVVHLYRSC